jgi:hypothetical protein
MVKPREVCIALIFVGIDSENQVGLCDFLGGLWLKETRLFVSSSTETYASFVGGRTSGTIRVSLCVSCIYFPLHLLCFLSSLPRVSFVHLF